MTPTDDPTAAPVDEPDDDPIDAAGRLAALPEQTAVLVVGGGPVGLLQSIQLHQLGVPNVVVERRTGPQPAPAAHVVNARTFEICRQAGIPGAAIDAVCQPPADGAWVRWVTSLVGEEVAVVPFERLHLDGSLDDVTPTPLRNLSQHHYEPVLRAHLDAVVAEARGGDAPVTVHDGVEWVTGEQDDDGVTSTLRDVATGEQRTIRSEVLVAADGAGSAVRRWTGIEMEGPTRLQAIVSINCEVDLRALVADRPATLYWVVDPDREGVFVAHDLDRTWVFMHSWDPDTEQLEDYTFERCAAIFRRALGRDDVPFEVRSVSPWTMTCQTAHRYRDGRVFLVGDAAHRFPPTGGMGLNTGAVDAQNLAWKLAAVRAGWADPALLDTYEAERRPIAEANGAASLANAIGILDVRVAAGLADTPEASRVGYEAVMASADGRDALRRAAEAQAGHFDMLGLQLGFGYGPEGGVVVDPEAAGDVSAADEVAEQAAGHDEIREYVPTTRPGRRLPHAWVARGGERVSTLDLVPTDRFVLLTSSPAWAEAAAPLAAAPTGPPLEVVLIGADGGDGAEVVDVDGAWARASDLPADGALLVRPDQHVGWRALGPVDDRTATLAEVLTTLSRGAARGAGGGAAHAEPTGAH